MIETLRGRLCGEEGAVYGQQIDRPRSAIDLITPEENASESRTIHRIGVKTNRDFQKAGRFEARAGFLQNAT